MYQLSEVLFSGEIHSLGYLSLNRLATSSILFIGPNPMKETLLINFENKQRQDWSFQLFDLNGKMIQDEKIRFSEGPHTYQIDGSHLATGVYFLTIHNKTESYVKQLIKC